MRLIFHLPGTRCLEHFSTSVQTEAKGTSSAILCRGYKTSLEGGQDVWFGNQSRSLDDGQPLKTATERIFTTR